LKLPAFNINDKEAPRSRAIRGYNTFKEALIELALRAEPPLLT